MLLATSVIFHFNSSVLIIIPPNLSDPYEIVSFFVGGRVESGSRWVWAGGREVEQEAERCQNDHLVGDCLAITWDQERGCRSFTEREDFLKIMKYFYRFSLTDIDCRRKDRFICERDPQ